MNLRASPPVARTLAGLASVALVAGCAQPDEAGSSATGEPSAASSAPSAPAETSGHGAGQAVTAPRPAGGPQEWVRRLVTAEDIVRDQSSAEDDVRVAAFETQVLYRQLARRPGWQRRVVRAVPQRYRATVRAHAAARRDFRSMHGRLSDTLPAWRIVEPAPPETLLEAYRAGQRRHGVDWEILAAINLVETGMGRIRGTSVAGARGPMQFIAPTWDRFGRGDIDDPEDAIAAAARHLAHHGAADGRLDRALYAYNNHPAYVRGVKAYAEVLREDPRALRGLHHWQVLYLSEIGDVWLPVGYERKRSVPVRRYVRNHPEHHLGRATG